MPDARWRNHATFVTNRAEVDAFLTAKRIRKIDYRQIKELWACRQPDRRAPCL